jgi:hypothetical protein
MSAKKKPEQVSSAKPVCKEEGCFHAPSNKGYCRKHFLGVLTGKALGDSKPRGRLYEAPMERKAKKVRAFEEALLENAELEDAEQRTGLSQIDLDIEGLDNLDAELFKKTG